MGPLTTLHFGLPPWAGRTETPRDIDALLWVPIITVMIGTPIVSAGVMALMDYPILGAWLACLYAITDWIWIGAYAPAAPPHTLKVIAWSLAGPAALLLPIGIWLGWIVGEPRPLEHQVAGRQIVPLATLAREERQSIRRSGTGISLGTYKLSLDRETRHLGVVGATGSGKTTVIRSVVEQAWWRGDKLLVLDVKPELTSLLPGKPILLAPWDKRSTRWDIAADCRTPADAAQLAAALVGKGEGANAVFRDAARQVFAALIVSAQKERPGKWDWSWLLARLEQMGADSGEGLAEMISRRYPRARAALAAGKTRASVLMDLSAHVIELVGQLADAGPPAEDGGRNKGLSLRAYLTHQSHSANIRPLVVQQDGRYKHLSQMLATAVYGLVAQTVLSPEVPEVHPAGGDQRQRTWIVLDEVAQLADLRSVRALAEVGRSKGLRLVVGAQNWHQVIELAGEHAAKALSAQIGTWLIGRQGDAEAEKWASQMAGDARFQRQQWSSPNVLQGQGSGSNITTSEEERPLIRPERFGALKGDGKEGPEMLLRTGGNLAWIAVPHLAKSHCRENHVPATWILPPEAQEPAELESSNSAPSSASAPESTSNDADQAPPSAPDPEAREAEEVKPVPIQMPSLPNLSDDDMEAMDAGDEHFIVEPQPEKPEAPIEEPAPTNLHARLAAAKARAQQQEQPTTKDEEG